VILTVTLNLAVDVTYSLAQARLGEHNRVELVGRRAGGKGVNVARVLSGLGRDVVVTGLLGGANGSVARAELGDAGLVEETVAIEGESRVTIVVVEDDGRVTGFSELGPEVSAAEWADMHSRFGGLSAGAEAVVLSGSLPRGVPEDAYAQLVSASAAPVLLDAEGAALARGVEAGPAVVKINRAELFGVVDGAGSDVVTAASSLRARGAGAVVVSCGAEGVVAVTDEGVWSAAPPEELAGNPTGAGDAVAAAVVCGMVDGSGWPERLAEAVALSAAAVAAPQAGSFDPAVYTRLRGGVEVASPGPSPSGFGGPSRR
jgi:1-phosphofructokinase family hexose kinase